jgi:hypothetical protein
MGAGFSIRDPVRVLYLGYHGSLVMTKKNLDTARFPPVANDWGIKYPIPNMAPPLMAEEEGPPT